MIKEELRKLIHKNSWKPDWSKWDQNELMSNSTFHDILKWLDFHDFIVIFDESCKLRQVGIFDESVFSMHWYCWWIGIFDESKFSANLFQRRYSLIQGNRKTFSLFFGYIHFFFKELNIYQLERLVTPAHKTVSLTRFGLDLNFEDFFLTNNQIRVP